MFVQYICVCSFIDFSYVYICEVVQVHMFYVSSTSIRTYSIFTKQESHSSLCSVRRKCHVPFRSHSISFSVQLQLQLLPSDDLSSFSAQLVHQLSPILRFSRSRPSTHSLFLFDVSPLSSFSFLCESYRPLTWRAFV